MITRHSLGLVPPVLAAMTVLAACQSGDGTHESGEHASHGSGASHSTSDDGTPAGDGGTMDTEAGGGTTGNGTDPGMGANSGMGTGGVYSTGGSGTEADTGNGSEPLPSTPAVPGADFYAPTPMHQLLQLPRAISWEALSRSVDDLVRFSWSVAGSNDFFLATDDGHEVDAAPGLAPDLGLASSATDDVLLRSMFQFIEVENGVYRITSSKHPNFSLDVDAGDSVILRDTRSMERDDNAAGYLGFKINGTGPYTLEAVGRWVVQSGALFTPDNGFTSKNLVVTGGSLSLSSGSGTSVALYNPPINFDIPFEFNPDGVARVTNAEVTPFSKDEDKQEAFAGKVTTQYSAQVSAAGLNSETKAAAKAMLEEIESVLAQEDSALRYPPEFYLALRDGFLCRVNLSSEATDAHLGQLSVPYVFFTNGADDQGTHHPFMVIATRGLPDSMALLWDIPHPPGGDPSVPYAEQPVTRSYHRENFIIKIPLRDYGLVSSLTENHMVSDLASDRGAPADHHSYASISAQGVAIDGVVIYPAYNAGLRISAGVGELSAHGHHAGQGLGTHYHADSHSATGEGLHLYNDSDYVGRHHPPIISMGFDGVAGYGVYPQGDSSLDGANVPLDDFGGHDHDSYGYHYHSNPIQSETSKNKVPFIAHQLPPLGAWAGRINDIPDFWNGTHPDYSGKGSPKYLGTGN